MADSLPRAVYENELARIKDDSERRKKFDLIIDEGRGSCLLRESSHAEVVLNALAHFDGERYRLIAWVIMPYHVHVMIEQIVGFPLAEIVGSCKSFTAKALNKQRNSSGPVWAREYFDRFIRDELHYLNVISYIENNPVKARLVQRAEDWRYSSAFNAEPAGRRRSQG